MKNNISKAIVTTLIMLLVFSSIAAITPINQVEPNVSDGSNTDPVKPVNQNPAGNQDQSNLELETVQESSNIKYKENNVDTNQWYEGETVRIDTQNDGSYIVESVSQSYEVTGRKSAGGSLLSVANINPTEFGTISDLVTEDDAGIGSMTESDIYDTDLDISGFQAYTYFTVITTITIRDIYDTGTITLNLDMIGNVEGDTGNENRYFRQWLKIYDFGTNSYDTLASDTSKTFTDSTESYSETYGRTITEDSLSASYNSEHINSERIVIRVELSVTLQDGTAVGDNNSYLDYACAYIDQLDITYDTDTVTSHTRSVYKYSSSNSIIHQLEYENFDYGSTITIYSPETWSYSSINPGANVTKSGNNHTVTSTVPTTYTIRFVSNSSNIMAISDVSADYMQSPSFESGDLGNFIDTYEPGTLNTSIVKDGTYSVRVHDDDNTGNWGDIALKTSANLKAGSYYISFSYYVESHSSTDITFYWRNSGWNTHNFEFTKNRWETVFFYFQHDGSTSGDRYLIFRLVDYSETGVVFLDDIDLWKANGQAENEGYSKTKFSAQFISWDGYQNPVIPNHEVQWELRDRTADTSIISKTLFTDSNGIASYTFKGSLESKEYEQRWWSYESTFYSDTETIQLITETTTDWTADQGQSGSISLSTDKEEGAYSIKMSQEFDTSSKIRAYVSKTYETSFDYFSVAIKLSSISNLNYLRIDFGSESVYYQSSTLSTSFKKYNFAETDIINNHLLGDTESWFGVQLFNSSNSAISYDVYIDSVHFIQAQKSYFTPISASSDPYPFENNGLKNDIKNYWDFSEGETEGWKEYTGGGNPLVIENGYVERELTGSNTFAGIAIDTISIDSSIYSNAIVRIKVNDTTGLYRVRFIGSSTYYHEFTPDGKWQQFEVVLADDNITDMFVQKWGDSDPALVQVDYVYLTNSLDQGHAFEFEEPNSELDSNIHGWGEQDISAVTSVVKNGYVEVTTTSTFDGMATNLEQSLSTASIEFEFVIRTTESTSLSNWQLSFYNDGSFQQAETLNDITSEFTRFRVIETNTIDFDNIRLWTSNNGDPGTIQVKYFRIIDTSQTPDLQVDSSTGLAYFDNGDNETDIYQTWVNGSNYGIYSEYELFYLPLQTSNTYSFTYTTYFSTGNDHVQTAATFYEYTYSNVAVFDLILETVSTSETKIDLIITTNMGGTYDYYLNNTFQSSGTFEELGNIVSLDRESDSGTYNYQIKFIGTDTNYRWINFTDSIPPTDERILIYVYDLQGNRLHQSPWDLYYNNSILETYSLTVEEGTFDPSLVEFKDLFGKQYTGHLLNTTETLSGVKVYQFQIQAYRVHLYNEHFDYGVKLSLNQSDTFINYTLSPGEFRSIWIRNQTTQFISYVAERDITGDTNSTTEVQMANETKPVSQSISFGVSANLETLLDGDDITNNEFNEELAAEEAKQYAINFTVKFFGDDIEIKLPWDTLFLYIFIGLISTLVIVLRRMKEKKNKNENFEISNTLLVGISLLIIATVSVGIPVFLNLISSLFNS